jgi:biotin carboxyl carrier protein
MRFVATVGDRQHTVEVDSNGHVRQVLLDGRELTVDWRLVGAEHTHLSGASPGGEQADHYSMLVGTHSFDAYVRAVEGLAGTTEGTTYTLEVSIAGRPYAVTVQDARSQALESLAGGPRAAGEVSIRAPMPGLVVSVLAGEGAEVRRGQTIVVLEAMKMENDLAAPRAGVIKVVHVARGQAVNQNDVLVTIGDPAEQHAPSAIDEAANGGT